MSKPLPIWKCHKEVEAFKIESISPMPGGGYRVSGEGFMVVVDQPTFLKHAPQPGWYYVRYADGYESFSPADAFEQGYTKIKKATKKKVKKQSERKPRASAQKGEE